MSASSAAGVKELFFHHATRAVTVVMPEPNIKTGWLSRYARMVTSANLGAVLK